MPQYEVSALRCPDGRRVTWRTDDERAAEFLARALGRKDWSRARLLDSMDFADVKLTRVDQSGGYDALPRSEDQARG
jgi:hypothetical protein